MEKIMVRIELRKDKCKCGKLKGVVSKRCWDCYRSKKYRVGHRIREEIRREKMKNDRVEYK